MYMYNANCFHMPRLMQCMFLFCYLTPSLLGTWNPVFITALTYLTVNDVCFVDLCGVCISWRLAESTASSRRPQVCKPCCCDFLLWRWQVPQAWILGLFRHGRVMYSCRICSALQPTLCSRDTQTLLRPFKYPADCSSLWRWRGWTVWSVNSG